MTRLTIVRHAPAMTGGTLAGRRDVAADCTDAATFDWLRARLGQPATVLVSPALRCRQTAQALGLRADATPLGLWEQDHGIWEGRPYAGLPDLGNLSTAELARHRPEGGESFDDMVARVLPVLTGLQGETLIVAHAGTARAALSLVVGHAALSFQIAPLSVTTIMRAGTDADAPWSVEAVNVTAS